MPPDPVLVVEARDIYRNDVRFAWLVDALGKVMKDADGDPPTFTMRELESAMWLALADHDGSRALRGARRR